ncbi:MAG: ankyrin [Desulfobulbus sp.]|nr:ankyrin [Desulfobulbus sp.]
MTTHEAEKTVCPTCIGGKVLSGVCETSSEWEGINSPDQQERDPESSGSGQVCTPDTPCPTCGGKGYV